jgi:hypothetical protein
VVENVAACVGRGSTCAAGYAAVRKIAEEGQISLDSVEEVGEGAGADMEQGVDDDGPDQSVDIDTFFRGFESAFESFEVGNDILDSRSSTEEIQDGLSGVMILIC